MTHLGDVNEKSTRTLKLLLRDAAGAPVSPGAVTGITIWIRDLRSNTLLVNGANALATGGAVGVDGYFTYPLTSTHTAAVGTLARQRRVVTLDIVFASGELTHEVSFDVVNLTDIT